MIRNPLAVFNISPEMSALEVEKQLLGYMAQITTLNAIYAKYFNKIKRNEGFSLHTKKGQEAEDLLARRYEFGLDLNSAILSEKEIEDFLEPITVNQSNELPTTPRLANERNIERAKRLEMFSLSSLEVSKYKGKIERARQAYASSGYQDDSKMKDVLIELKYMEGITKIAERIATNLSAEGYFCTAEQFKQVLMQSKNYTELTEMYHQIDSKEKRENFIPEAYIQKNMADSEQFSTPSPETVKRLIAREKAYESKYYQELGIKYVDPELAKEMKLAENQDHDYAWGIVLDEPRRLINNEPVNSPIFKGRITVDRIGSFSEYSLFQKKKKEREYDVKIRKRSTKPSRGSLSRLRIDQEASSHDAMSEDKKYRYITMREYFYRHEACKTLVDHLLRVTKTDTEGRTRTSIIISPFEYSGLKESDMREFLKNIYFSDYMLDVAEANGGYAGKVMGKDGKFFISNKYNHEEIASALLFSNGQKGTILDCRDKGQRKKYEGVTKDDFIRLLNQTEREKFKDE